MKDTNKVKPFTLSDQIAIGTRLRERREELGLTMVEVANAIGYKSSCQITKMETGNVNLKMDKLYELAQVLHVTPDYIFYGDSYDKVYKDIIEKMDDRDLDQLEIINDFFSTIIRTMGSGVVA